MEMARTEGLPDMPSKPVGSTHFGGGLIWERSSAPCDRFQDRTPPGSDYLHTEGIDQAFALSRAVQEIRDDGQEQRGLLDEREMAAPLENRALPFQNLRRNSPCRGRFLHVVAAYDH